MKKDLHKSLSFVVVATLCFKIAFSDPNPAFITKKENATSLPPSDNRRDDVAYLNRIVGFLTFQPLPVYAAPPGSPYNAGETLDPSCSPGDPNCTVASSTGSSPWVESGDDIYFSTGSVSIGTTSDQSVLSVVGSISVVDDEDSLIIGTGNTSSASGYYPGFVPSNVIIGRGNTASSYAESEGDLGSVILGICNTGSGSGDYGARVSVVGSCNVASNYAAAAFGTNNTASGEYSLALGACSRALGDRSTASGYSNAACGHYSTASGYYNTAFATDSSAFGWRNRACLAQATAVGHQNTASGYRSSAFGKNNQTTGCISTASGYSNCTCLGAFKSLAIGSHNVAAGCFASAVGASNTVTGCNASSFGRLNCATADGASIFGGGGNGLNFMTNSTACSTMIGPRTGSTIHILATGEVRLPYITATSTATSTFAGNISAVSYFGDGSQLTGVSDKQAKQNFTPLNKDEVLSKIAGLNIEQWEYKNYPGVTHIGPYAQEFREAFGLGKNDTSISLMDPAGVALVGIQALNERLDELQESSAFISSLALQVSSTTVSSDSPFASVFEALQSFGASVIDGIAYLKNVFVEKLTIGSEEKAGGITIYSEDGTPYCITVANDGQLETSEEPGTCDDQPESEEGNDNEENNNDNDNSENVEDPVSENIENADPVTDGGDVEEAPDEEAATEEVIPEETPAEDPAVEESAPEEEVVEAEPELEPESDPEPEPSEPEGSSSESSEPSDSE